jgi:hypothetical protein
VHPALITEEVVPWLVCCLRSLHGEVRAIFSIMILAKRAIFPIPNSQSPTIAKSITITDHRITHHLHLYGTKAPPSINDRPSHPTMTYLMSFVCK